MIMPIGRGIVMDDLKMDELFVSVTAAVVSKQIDDVKKTLVGEIQSFWIRNTDSFKSYLLASNKKYNKTKTLLYKDRSVSINDIYVGTKLKLENSIVDEMEFFENFMVGSKFIVSAAAGAGKSFFSKWLFLKILSSKKYIPFIIELRHLNDSEYGLIDSIVHDLRINHKMAITRDLLLELLSSGKFCLILDGYDELSISKSKVLNDELKRLDVCLDKAPVVITSRPGSDDIGYLSDYLVYKVMPLQKEQAVKLIEKLDYDDKVKKSFLDKLRGDLFSKHIDFLSNPLLLTIMLMTYSDLAEIPSKMHIFYEQAFDTLFYRHDSSKGMYRRQLKSSLAIDDFRDVLSCMSSSSYMRGQLSLTVTDLISYIRKSKKIIDVPNFQPRDYIDDLVQSVCILVPDGTRYVYNHRSFQEYFSAYFLVNIPFENKLDLYRRFLSKEDTDNALRLAFEMNRMVIEREFVIPMLRLVLEECKTPEELLVRFCNGLNIQRNKVKYVSDGKIKNRMKSPHFFLDQASEFWSFQTFLEKVYVKKAKKIIKFGVMTIKGFEEQFGKTQVSQYISMDDIYKNKESFILNQLGIIEISKRRLDFLNILYSDLVSKNKSFDVKDIEDWM